MKKLPWTVWEAEKNGVPMLIITMGEERVKGVSNPNIGYAHARKHMNNKQVFKSFEKYKYKYSLPFSSNDASFRNLLRFDHGAVFFSRKKGGDDCWYCDEWVEELREFASPVAGVIPVFSSEQS